MLKSIEIKNFALIEHLLLEFDKGLNIITGETGAGKSIIVDALMLLLGERSSADYIRSGEKKAIVEGIFDISKVTELPDILNDNEIEANEEELIIRREISDKGSSRAFVNDSPVQIAVLKQIGDLLVDFHGQHDHQMLLRKEAHIKILDSIAIDKELAADYSDKFKTLKELIKNYEILLAKETEIKNRTRVNSHELAEILKSNPQNGEDETLEQEISIMENSETLFNYTNELYADLYDEEACIYSNLTKAEKILAKISSIDGKFAEYIPELHSATVTVSEIATFTKDYCDNIQYDSGLLEQKRERLMQLRSLTKRYGTLENANLRRSELQNELDIVTNFDEEITERQKQVAALKAEIGIIAETISEKRADKAVHLSDEIEKALVGMGIVNSTFQVGINQNIVENDEIALLTTPVNGKIYELNVNGIDKVEFFISLNKGETPKPLAQIASGGEISRTMLAIKSIVSGADNVPILVFDEIDTGISGRVAQKVGLVMKKLGGQHQIISITHLAQIAALANQNISVQKIEDGERTTVNAKIIAGDEKLFEVAKLLGGDKITDITLAGAKELCEVN